MNIYDAIIKRDNYGAQADRWEKRAKKAGKGSKEYATYISLVEKYVELADLVKNLKAK